MHENVTKLVLEVKALCITADSLSSSTSWPDDFTASNSAPNHVPAAEKIVAWHLPENSPTSPLYRAIQQAALHVDCNFIAQKEEVGRQFLGNHACYELIGPTGHFRSDKC